jgi:hypothetical protein
LALLGVIVLSTPAVAMATSAGDQQYIDPLAGSSTPTAASHPPPHTTTSSPSLVEPVPSSSSSVSSAPTATTASAPSSTSSSAAPAAPAATAATLPYTGLNLWLCALVGCGLLGAGWTVRRLARGT